MTLRICAISTVGILSALLLAAGIALMQSEVFSTITTNRLKKAIVLVEGSLVFESWKSPPPPVYMEYFFFNVTNVNEIIEGARPEVKQVGPYTYREYRYKENVTMVGNNTKVSAYTTKSFVFLAEKSVGDPAVEYITTVNIPAWAVMEKMKHSFLKKNILSALMKSIGSTIFTTRTVDELLWGYEDPLLVKVAILNSDVEKFFGLMYKKNGSNSGEFVYNTGLENYMDYGRVETWKNQRQLTFWTSNQSNSINGSDGSAFHPLLTKDERIYVFNPDLCRSIYMDFEKDLEVKGIPAYRFTPPRSVLASKEENPANEGFCVSRKECLGTGLLKVSPCRKGVPVVASFPHFHLADEKYVSSIGGMSPQSQHHQTFLDLNPTTGVILRANKRAQVNYLIDKIIGFPDTRALTQTVFPIMFLNESVVIDDASAAKVQRLLLIRNLVVNLPLIIVAMGAILLAVFIILVIRACKQKNAVKRIVFTKPLYATSTEEDTSYCPVSDKEKDDPQNGTYIGMTTTGDPQA